MQLLLILSVIALAQAASVKKTCKGVVIRNVKFEKEVLYRGLDRPYQLAYDNDTSTLFFSYANKSANGAFESGYLNLKTNEFNVIPGISSGFSNAVDNKRHIVYLGGGDGIYTFNKKTKRAEHLTGESYIWQMFHNDILYYTTHPEEKAYSYKNGGSKTITRLSNTKTTMIAVDYDKNIYVSNSSGLFLYKKSNGAEINLGDYVVNGFAADLSGGIYFSTIDGLFYINDINFNLPPMVETLVLLDYVYGLAIVGDGSVIYSTRSSIKRLKPTNVRCNAKDSY